jgi:hypothetical protein
MPVPSCALAATLLLAQFQQVVIDVDLADGVSAGSLPIVVLDKSRHELVSGQTSSGRFVTTAIDQQKHDTVIIKVFSAGAWTESRHAVRSLIRVTVPKVFRGPRPTAARMLRQWAYYPRLCEWRIIHVREALPYSRNYCRYQNCHDAASGRAGFCPPDPSRIEAGYPPTPLAPPQ